MLFVEALILGKLLGLLKLPRTGVSKPFLFSEVQMEKKDKLAVMRLALWELVDRISTLDLLDKFGHETETELYLDCIKTAEEKC